MKTLTDRNTRLVSVEREAKDGDTVVIDFEGFLDGKPFDGGKGENYSLELGSHTFVPGFEEQLVGVKAGDEKDLDVTFPEDYHKDLAGKAVVFKVKVHEVKEKEVPALDDEFAKDVSEFDTLKDLKADLKKKITAEREETAKRAFEDALMEQVADNITADVPDAMVEAQARQYLDNFKMQLAQQGIQMIYDETHMVLAQGNYVLAVSEGTYGGAPTSYYDLWRVENGKIAEHWDVMETIADPSTWQNDNGKF